MSKVSRNRRAPYFTKKTSQYYEVFIEEIEFSGDEEFDFEGNKREPEK